MKNKFKIIFFGAGPIIEQHIKSFKGERGVELFGILNRTKSKAVNLKKQYKINHVYSSYADLDLKKSDEKKIAVIGVSVLSLFNVCKKVFKFFDYCLIEKPPGYNFEQSLKILNLSKKYNTKVFVALNRRSYPSTIELKNLLNKEKGKRIVNITDYEVPSLQKNKSKELINNWMFANSIHMIDLTN